MSNAEAGPEPDKLNEDAPDGRTKAQMVLDKYRKKFGPGAPDAAGPSAAPVGGIRVRAADPLDTEYRYYSKLLTELIMNLKQDEDRKQCLNWVHKLSSAGYNVSLLRDKRNRFTLMLCMSLLQESIEGPFVNSPPTGILPDLKYYLQGGSPPLHKFDWEKDTTWEDEIKAIKDINDIVPGSPPKKSKCYMHKDGCPPTANLMDAPIGEILDKQFQFLLYTSKPYVAMLRRGSDRIRAGKWIQALCSMDRSYCVVSKGIRNDYMMILIGHLANQDLVFPFDTVPTEKILSLQKMCVLTEDSRPVTDPTHPRTAQFFMDIPTPDEGAFAFLALTGDLYSPKNQ